MFLDAIVFLLALLAGCAVFVFSNSPKTRRRSIVYILSLIGIAAAYWIAVGMAEPEWNPQIGSDSEITGVWTKGNERLELSADGHFVYGTPPNVKTGSWSRDDWNLTLKPGVTNDDEESTLMRFIQFRGRYRILTSPKDTANTWNYDYGFAKN